MALYFQKKNNFSEKKSDFEPYTPLMLIMAPIQTICAHIFSNVIWLKHQYMHHLIGVTGDHKLEIDNTEIFEAEKKENK